MRYKRLPRYTKYEKGLTIEHQRKMGNPSYNPEESLITENYIPKQVDIINKLKRRYDLQVSKFKSTYEFVNENFLQSIESHIKSNINDPVVFWIYHSLHSLQSRIHIAEEFLNGEMVWKEYRNRYEQLKGRSQMMYFFEQLFRNIKTKKI